MKILPLLSITLLLAGPNVFAGGANLELLTNDGPTVVFSGAAREISAVFRNPGDQIFETDVRTRMWQASSATAVLVTDAPWKTMQVLPRQTVLESALLNFPAVRAKTKFLVQWCENTNHVLGTTEVLVYPTNLLDELKLPVADQDDSGKQPGVLDPHHLLKPALKNAGVKFEDLDETGLAGFSGRLALIGPCPPDDPEADGLAEQVSQLAKRGTAVVWIQAPPQKADAIAPSFYVVPKVAAAVVVVEPDLVADLADNPQSQLNLIYFCKLALQPEPFQLPNLTNQ